MGAVFAALITEWDESPASTFVDGNENRHQYIQGRCLWVGKMRL